MTPSAISKSGQDTLDLFAPPGKSGAEEPRGTDKHKRGGLRVKLLYIKEDKKAALFIQLYRYISFKMVQYLGIVICIQSSNFRIH